MLTHLSLKEGNLYTLSTEPSLEIMLKKASGSQKLEFLGLICYDSLALWQNFSFDSPENIHAKISNRIGDLILNEPFLLMEKAPKHNIYQVMQTFDDKCLFGYIKFYFGDTSKGVFTANLYGDLLK